VVKKQKPITLDQFQKWFDGLSDLDRMNFKTLINLPTAMSVLSKMPGGEYQDMAIFGLAVVKAVRRKSKKGG